MPDLLKIDQLDKRILEMLIANARTPFSDIAKELGVAPGTIHGRVRRLEEGGIIRGATLSLNYAALGMTFTCYIGIFLNQTSDSEEVMRRLREVPQVTEAHLVTGQYSIYCKIRARDTTHAKEVIYTINSISGIVRTESIISLEQSINDKNRLMASILEE